MILTRFRLRQPGAPIYRIVWWHLCHAVCCIWIWPCYRYRARGVENIPAEGPVLFVSNHQSYLDPILVGLGGYRRQFYAMARSSLFRFRFFSWLIRSLNAIPIDRGTGDTAAMRKCIDVLNKNQALLIFPEGTRTLDGVTQRFNPGTFLLIKRAKPWVVPVAIEGAHEVWPKNRKGPRLTGRISVMYSKPVAPETLVAMEPAEAMEHLRAIVEKMRLELANKLV